MKYIDVHAHIFPSNIAPKVIEQLETYYGYRWAGTGELVDLKQSIRTAGISRTVIFSSATKPEQVRSINTYIASLAQAEPELFLGFGTMHHGYDDIAGELERMRKLGLRGLKLHPDFQQFYVDAEPLFRLYELLGDSLPILFHIGDRKTDFSSPYRLARVLEHFPKLRVIAAHMGGYSEWEEAWKHLIGKNLLMDISSTIGHLPDDEVRDMVRAHGVGKVLFASDYPAMTQQQAIDSVLRLGFDSAELEDIFWRNAARELRIPLA